jgi:type VI secretion system protein ImpG
MQDSGLKDYYERELRYLRELGREFGQQHPEVASALRLEDKHADDPHVERLLEGFAFLAARVHRRIDDDFPEITQALLNIVSPHYLRPIPSMSIAQMYPDPAVPANGYPIAAGSVLVAPPAEGVRCRFQTCYDVTLWPLSVSSVNWSTGMATDLGAIGRDAGASLRMRLRSAEGVPIGSMSLDRLRFYLHGDVGLVAALYQTLDNDCLGVLVRNPKDPGSAFLLPPRSVTPVGFEDNERLLPYPVRSFAGFSQLIEYFTFPHKYFFLDLKGLERLQGTSADDEVELVFLVRPIEGGERQELLERYVKNDTMRLGCTPVVNLFTAEAEPLRLDQRRAEYLVRPQGPREHPYEVFSVDDVWAVTSTSNRVPFEPFFAYRHAGREESAPLFWHAQRTPGRKQDRSSTEVTLAFVDLSGRSMHPPYPTAMARLTVFNGPLPSKLDITRERGGLELKGGGAPLSGIDLLMHPTRPIQPPLDSSLLWRLVSQLSLNYLSLVDDNGDALRELLRIYNFGKADLGEKQIRGILRVESQPWHAQVRGEQGYAFARGRRITMEFDEEHFSGGGTYLLASVLERFLASYATLNSFTSLVAKVRSRLKTSTLREWEPRSGSRQLI